MRVSLHLTSVYLTVSVSCHRLLFSNILTKNIFHTPFPQVQHCGSEAWLHITQILSLPQLFKLSFSIHCLPTVPCTTAIHKGRHSYTLECGLKTVWSHTLGVHMYNQCDKDTALHAPTPTANSTKHIQAEVRNVKVLECMSTLQRLFSSLLCYLSGYLEQIVWAVSPISSTQREIHWVNRKQLLTKVWTNTISKDDSY